MPGTVKHALPEHWTELHAARTQKARCADEINAIKASCAASHGKQSVSECRGCYSEAIDVMQSRYCAPSGREWFTQRRAFINELGVLFADAKEGKVSLPFIEARIESEKEAWYRWVLRTYPAFLAMADGGADVDELRAMLDDPDKTREQLIEKVWEAVGRSLDWAAEMNVFINKFEAVKDDSVELKKLYMTEFFTETNTGEPLEHAHKYLDAYRSADEKLLEEVIDTIAQDEQASKTSQPQRDSHRRRLDELRRAKTAFEQNRMQAKARRQEAQARAATDELYNLPPCAVCGKTVDAKHPIACTTCQVLLYLGDPRKMTVWCSEYCCRRGFENHADAHACVEGEGCAGDEDEDMDGSDRSVICKQCIEDRTPTIWCTEECANVHMTRHLEEAHGRTEPPAMGNIKSLVLPFGEFSAKTLKEKNPGVKFRDIA